MIWDMTLKLTSSKHFIQSNPLTLVIGSALLLALAPVILQQNLRNKEAPANFLSESTDNKTYAAEFSRHLLDNPPESKRDSDLNDKPNLNHPLDVNFSPDIKAPSFDVISELVAITDREQQAIAVDEAAEAILLLPASEKKAWTKTLASNAQALNLEDKMMAWQVLKQLSPIEASAELVDAFYQEWDVEIQAEIIRVMQMAVEYHHFTAHSTPGYREEEQLLKHFFRQNLGSFHADIHAEVFRAARVILGEDEAGTYNEAARLPKAELPISTIELSKNLSEEEIKVLKEDMAVEGYAFREQ